MKIIPGTIINMFNITFINIIIQISLVKIIFLSNLIRRNINSFSNLIPKLIIIISISMIFHIIILFIIIVMIKIFFICLNIINFLISRITFIYMYFISWNICTNIIIIFPCSNSIIWIFIK